MGAGPLGNSSSRSGREPPGPGAPTSSQTGPTQSALHMKSVRHHQPAATLHNLTRIGWELSAIRKDSKKARKHLGDHSTALTAIRKNVHGAKPQNVIKLPGLDLRTAEPQAWGLDLRTAEPETPNPKWGLDLRTIPPETTTGQGDKLVGPAQILWECVKEAEEWLLKSWDKYNMHFKAVHAIGANLFEHLHEKSERAAVVSLVATARNYAHQASEMLKRYQKLNANLEIVEANRSFETYLALSDTPMLKEFRSMQEAARKMTHELVFEEINARTKLELAIEKYAEFGRAIARSGIAENPTVVKLANMLKTIKPLVEIFDMVANCLEVIEAAIDSFLFVSELYKNRPHEALYRLGDIVFDVTLILASFSAFILGSLEVVWFLILCITIYFGKKFLGWLRELIEDPNHQSLDKKLDELRKAGKLKTQTLDEVLDQARREGRLSNVTVIWPSN
jgi:hypothetical protein